MSKMLYRWPRCVAAAVLLSLVAVTAVAIAVSGRGGASHQAAAPRARQYAAFTQCLLTGQNGVESPTDAPLWAAMQRASTVTAAKSQFLALPVGVQPDAALGYATALVVRGCDVILATDGAAAEAVAAVAKTNPARHFLLVGTGASTGNTAVVPDNADSSAVVVKALTDASNGGFPIGPEAQ